MGKTNRSNNAAMNRRMQVMRTQEMHRQNEENEQNAEEVSKLKIPEFYASIYTDEEAAQFMSNYSGYNKMIQDGDHRGAQMAGNLGAIRSGDSSENNAPDKVLDYNRNASTLQDIKKSSVAGKSYYEGLVHQYFYTDWEIQDKDEQAAVYKEVWENSPKERSIPALTSDTEKLFGINLKSGKTVYYKAEYVYDKQGNDKYFLTVTPITSNKEKTFTTTETPFFARDYHIERAMYGEDDHNSMDHDNTFPPIPQGSNYKRRLTAFFKDSKNKEAKYAYFDFINGAYDAADRLNTNNSKKSNSDHQYPFSGKVSGGKYVFFVDGIFVPAANKADQIMIAKLDVICLSGTDARGVDVVQENPSKKTFIDAAIETHFLKNPNDRDHPDFIGLEQIIDPDERELVKDYVWRNMANIFTDTHFEQVLSIDGDRIAYSFTFENSKELADIPESKRSDIPEGKRQKNIYIKRIGKIGSDREDIADPEELRINDVFGYSDNFTDAEFKAFVTARYSIIKDSDIKGNNKKEMIDSVNVIIKEKAQTSEWYSANKLYNITVFTDMSTLKAELTNKTGMNFYVAGLNEPKKDRAKVKGKTVNDPGKLTDEPLENPDVQFISDETEGIKPWSASEMKFLEMSFQKLSPLMLSILSGHKYFRQDYCKLAKDYDKAGGLTFHGCKNVAIFDPALRESSRVIGSEIDLSSIKTWTITHETSHIIQNTPAGDKKDSKLKYGDLFNAFYKSINAKGPTEYSRSSGISTPESEFFPEAFTLFLHNPEFLSENFPKIYMWFYFLQLKGKAPSGSESSAFVVRWDKFVRDNNREPDMKEISKLVLNE